MIKLMEEPLSQLPPLEDILRAVAGNSPQKSQKIEDKTGDQSPRQQFRICPILKRKDGVGEFEIFDSKVVCKYHKVNYPPNGNKKYIFSQCRAYNNHENEIPCPYSGLPGYDEIDWRDSKK